MQTIKRIQKNTEKLTTKLHGRLAMTKKSAAKRMEDVELDYADAEVKSPSREDLKKFECHIEYWVKTLGLQNYAIDVIHDPTMGHVGAYTELHHREAQLVIAIGDYTDKYSIAYLARHECLEAMLEPMYKLVDGCSHIDISQRAGHEVIFRLERLLPMPTDEEAGYKPPVKEKTNGKKNSKCNGRAKAGRPKKVR